MATTSGEVHHYRPAGPSVEVAPVSDRYLSEDERITVSDGLRAKMSLTAIAAGLGRSTSTISREVKRDSDPKTGKYRPSQAHRIAARRRARPKKRKLAINTELCEWIQSGLELRWSPEQLSNRLVMEFPDSDEMRIAAETIYQGLYNAEETGLRRVWALVFTPVFSRYTFVWLSFSQNMVTVIDGFEAAWEFYGGVFKVVIPDNMATVVTKADALDPVLNQGFVEYAQARGFVVDPARVRSPQDKARVERAVQFVQTSFWAGEDFGCMAEAQTAAVVWCRGRAGLRTHRRLQAQPAPAGPYDLPLYRTAKGGS